MSAEVNIRSFSTEDVKELNKIRRSEGVFETILSLKDETVNQTYHYFTGERIHTFIAENKSKHQIIGYIKLVIDEEKRRRHKANISIAIHNDYQGNGVGTKLFNEAVDLAENWLMLRKLELTVLETNKDGIELYKKMGFKVEGISKEDTVVNGRYEDVVFMGMIFNR
ncbi:GNAT family N-acetyltransferase [Vagococcus fluvialis]|uniref:GNAT family N-acetyltransferase n=1 Tax=Vagococcus fluvialis TaxID=2738 RepID=UPI001A8C9306|nr:GNAT family N-acetyltransferase [Vagococcus fluvialis]MBO0430189.1 GNAT family N-acetyltransferase [Vagococcus fluvialis]